MNHMNLKFRRFGIGPISGSIAIGTILGMIGSQQASATVHLWRVNELYSNADGSVQFVEFFTTFNSQQFSAGVELRSMSNGTVFNSFVFPTNTPAPTSNHHLLLATPGFDALPGAVTPDFVLPAGPFFDPDPNAVNISLQLISPFAELYTFNGSDLPTDGVLSMNRDLTTGVNSPTNFAGQTGQLGGAPPLTGDLDGDGFVGFGDLNIVLGNWNQNVAAGDPLAGDPSGDGFVGFEDLNEVLGNWNAGSPPGDAVVPEPSTLMLLGCTGLAVLRRR